MGLFTKKDPCAICGGKVKGLFSRKVAGLFVCDDCYGNVDLPEGAVDQMTINDFKAYMQFRSENSLLKQKFQVTNKVDFGLFGMKVLFDEANGLLCFDKNLDGTIFEAGQITGFVIREDSTVICQGGPQGLETYQSAVYDRVMAMAPRIDAFRIHAQMRRLSDNDSPSPYHDFPEPFEKFYVDVYFQGHPYWSVYTAEMSGPQFSSSLPDVNEYLNEYYSTTDTLRTLADVFMAFAFPNAGEGDFANAINQSAAPAAPASDPVEEIKRYGELFAQGLITEEEFAAKKRQLLGL